MAEGIAHGRLMLIRCARQDYGYDPKAWHDHLAELKLYASRSRMKPGVYPVGVLRATGDSKWRDAVQLAESEELLERIQSEQRHYLNACDRADGKWAGKARTCPACNTAFTSRQDRGQYPECGLIFFASHPDGNDNWWREEWAEQ